MINTDNQMIHLELKDDTYTTIELQNKKIKYSMNKSKAEASLGDVLVSDTPTFEWRVFQRISVTAYGSVIVNVKPNLIVIYRKISMSIHI